MGDNIAVTPGVGQTVSTEEVATLNGASVTPQHLQRVVLASRTADGVAEDIVFTPNDVARFSSSAASTNATHVKTGSGLVDQIKCRNTAAYPVLVILYDDASNPPVVGTSTIRDIFEFPANMATPGSYDDLALKMSNGIGFALTKSDGTTPVAAGDLIHFSLYYQ